MGMIKNSPVLHAASTDEGDGGVPGLGRAQRGGVAYCRAVGPVG